MTGIDIEGQSFCVGDYVYTCHAARGHGNSKRLLRCKVLEINETGNKCKLEILETKVEISKLCSSVIYVA